MSKSMGLDLVALSISVEKHGLGRLSAALVSLGESSGGASGPKGLEVQVASLEGLDTASGQSVATWSYSFANSHPNLVAATIGSTIKT